MPSKSVAHPMGEHIFKRRPRYALPLCLILASSACSISFVQAPMSAESNSLPVRQRFFHGANKFARLSTQTRFDQALDGGEANIRGHAEVWTGEKSGWLRGVGAIAAFSLPSLAHAEGEDIAGAFVAYGHYLSIVLATSCLVAERFIIKPNMTAEEESTLRSTDTAYGLAGLLSLVTGYFRVTQFGKGWSFYQHEPLFWLKVIFVAIAGAISFFVTTTIIKRAVEQNNAGDAGIAPVSEKLASRLTSLVNAQLLAIGSIPLTATLMARGVGYVQWFPWEAGAASATLALGTFGFKYVKEALDWSEGGDEE